MNQHDTADATATKGLIGLYQAGSEASILVLSGEPIGEPIARYGPMVMIRKPNSRRRSKIASFVAREG